MLRKMQWEFSKKPPQNDTKRKLKDKKKSTWRNTKICNYSQIPKHLDNTNHKHESKSIYKMQIQMYSRSSKAKYTSKKNRRDLEVCACVCV